MDESNCLAQLLEFTMCMNHSDHGNETAPHQGIVQSCVAWYRKPLGILTLVLAVAIGVYLWVFHAQHVLAALPFLIFLACPLMHLFGHHHGNHRAGEPVGKLGSK